MSAERHIGTELLESYVFGTATPQERQEVECLSHIYPEVKAELEEMQVAFEMLAEKGKKAAPAELKNDILGAIEGVQQEGDLQEDAPTAITKVIPMTAEKADTPTRSAGAWKVAATVAILIGLGAGFLWLNTSGELQGTQEQLADLEKEISEQQEALTAELTNAESRLADLNEQLGFIANPNTQKVGMGGTENYANSLATIYWNKESGQTLLELNTLAELSAEEQYQLWAIVDGTPVDMGVFDALSDMERFVSMNDVAVPQAFAITIEKAGGSPTPTLEKMVVVGNV